MKKKKVLTTFGPGQGSRKVGSPGQCEHEAGYSRQSSGWQRINKLISHIGLYRAQSFMPWTNFGFHDKTWAEFLTLGAGLLEFALMAKTTQLKVKTKPQ